MEPYFIRSTIFNLCFYMLTAVSCILLLPTLFLPRRFFMAVVYGFVNSTTFLEKYIIGLTYEVRGLEYLPNEGSYIVAAKHQSAYETLKLHILFRDPAVVLKKELLKIPLWGQYLKKSDVIAIDRGTPSEAIESLKEGARRMAEQKRPMIIFPQGTRVPTEITSREKPYKIGIVRMQEATGLPIIPMALNSGFFYPKHAWCKKPGRVVFEFLPPVMPSKNPTEILNHIEMKVEEKTSQLMEEAKEKHNEISKKQLAWSFALLLILAAAYTANWFYAADLVKRSITNLLEEIKNHPTVIVAELSEPVISGFPFKIKLSAGQQYIETATEEFAIEQIDAESWPMIGMPISLETGGITYFQKHWLEIIFFETLQGEFTFFNNLLNIKEATIRSGITEIKSSGSVDFDVHPYPGLDLELAIKNFAHFVTDLVQKGAVEQKAAMMATLALQALQSKEGIINTTLSSEDRKIYLGPVRIIKLPEVQ
ncbi:MAG: DUF2125 domain-containing protein [Alphaproteobacteria bacterium]|nr:DUF2125 domain-containing protein [Alphaproteobacteria bacterium]